LDKSDFEVPSHIDINKVNKLIDLQPVPYWRNLKYRLMCYFWIKNFWKYTEGFDYVMRLDDDSFIEETIVDDLFNICLTKNLVYISNFIHIDCGLCNYNMKEFFQKEFPNNQQLDGCFVKSNLNESTPIFNNFKTMYEIMFSKKYDKSDVDLNMPIMYYNNFFITSTAFWKQSIVQNLIQKIDDDGGIFYYRYGDAPLQTLIVTMLASSQISKVKFKYSKRLQREVFIDNENNFHSYMPSTYNKSSCITDK